MRHLAAVGVLALSCLLGRLPAASAQAEQSIVVQQRPSVKSSKPAAGDEPLHEPAQRPAFQKALSTCNDRSCGTCSGCYGLSPRGLWVRGEYLLWWTKGMYVPPLVTTGPTGRLDDPATSILYGGDEILDDARSGFRVSIGGPLGCYGRFGWEADYLLLGEIDDDFFAASNATGSPNLFRPFFNVNPRDPMTGEFAPPAREAVELVSTPGQLAGSVRVEAFSELQGAGARLRCNLCCSDGCVSLCDPCGGAYTLRQVSRFDFLLGYRYLRLREGVTIREDLTSLLPPPNQGETDIFDAFDTRNEFHGVDFGVVWELTRGRWSLELLGKMALGTVEQVVNINGQSVHTGTAMGANDGTFTGGLLAQRTNIGSHSRNEFAIVPELAVTLGLQLAPRLKVTAGYTFLYWSRVARPGEHIDLDVNPDLLPPEFDPFAGAARPRFAFRDTDFWAQGIRVGAEYRW